MTTDHLADGLDAAADHLTTVDRTIPALAIPAAALAGTDAGVPGRLGHDLHAHWQAVLTARSQEAAASAGRLTALAASLRATTSAYEATDTDAAHRIHGSAR